MPTQKPMPSGSSALMYSLERRNRIFSGSPCSQLCWCSLERRAVGRRERRMARTLSFSISRPMVPRKTT